MVAAVSLGLAALNGISRIAATPERTGSQAVPQASTADFASFLSGTASSTVRSIADAERAGIAGLQGKASVREVVDKMMQAEQQLQIALAVRDKTIAAVQEISRMAI